MYLVKPIELHQMDLVDQLQQVATEQPIELHQMGLVDQLQQVATDHPGELHQMGLVDQLQQVVTDHPIELHRMDLVDQLQLQQVVVIGGTRRLKLLVILKKGFNMKPFLFILRDRKYE